MATGQDHSVKKKPAEAPPNGPRRTSHKRDGDPASPRAKTSSSAACRAKPEEECEQWARTGNSDKGKRGNTLNCLNWCDFEEKVRIRENMSEHRGGSSGWASYSHCLWSTSQAETGLAGHCEHALATRRRLKQPSDAGSPRKHKRPLLHPAPQQLPLIAQMAGEEQQPETNVLQVSVEGVWVGAPSREPLVIVLL